jgi:hypothetical protein
LGALAAALAAAPAAAEERCRAELLPQLEPAPSPESTSSDLVRLRDFGGPEAGLQGEPPFSLSPDGRFAAMVLRRADPAKDSYCIGVAIVALDGSHAARLVDVGGEFIVNLSDIRSIPDVPVGNAEAVTPSWSPDGRWLAYLRRDGGRTRVWRAPVDGSGAKAVTSLDEDARAVRWSEDGRSLIVRTRPGIAAGEAAIADEERSGFCMTAASGRSPDPDRGLPSRSTRSIARVDPETGRIVGPSRPAPGTPRICLGTCCCRRARLAGRSPGPRRRTAP